MKVGNWVNLKSRWTYPVTIVIGTLMTVLIFGVIAMGVIGKVKVSDYYNLTLMTIQNDPRAEQFLGRSIDDGWFVKSSKSEEGDMVQLSIPVHGSQAKAVALAILVKIADQWEIKGLVLEFEDQPRVVLVDPADTGLKEYLMESNSDS